MLNQIWFNNHPAKWLLLPFAAVFWLLTQIRRAIYNLGLKQQTHPGVPVIVVGNISVGGNGKTPVVMKIVEWLIDSGYEPGVLSRGYGGNCRLFPHKVLAVDTAEFVGDEPKLMATRLDCPVVIDPKRARGAETLVKLGCNIIVCDDGLQHYALKRDIELVVMDDRGVGNGCLLPMGPLRELPARLKHVDSVIHNGNQPFCADAHLMTLQPDHFYSVSSKDKAPLSAANLNKTYPVNLHAIAGIGDPNRFFSTLANLGIKAENETGFVDHHKFTAQDLTAFPTVMTEKDAVKCVHFAHEDCWYLRVDAQLPDRLKAQLLAKIKDITSNYAS